MRISEFKALEEKHREIESEVTSPTINMDFPVVIRLDGHAFRTYTRKLDKPFDARLVQAMDAVTRFLVEETKADVGYTQSDEISLAFMSGAKLPFSGRILKICSLWAGMASAKLNEAVAEAGISRSNGMPYFDCRISNRDTLEDLADYFLWRETDGMRNSTAMLAQSLFSKKELFKVNQEGMREMLRRRGCPWEHLPIREQRGAYFYREVHTVPMDEETLAKIPEKNRAQAPTIIQRTKIVGVEHPPLEALTNPTKVLFLRASPLYKEF